MPPLPGLGHPAGFNAAHRNLWQPGMTTVPVQMDEARGFFSVIRYQEAR